MVIMLPVEAIRALNIILVEVIQVEEKKGLLFDIQGFSVHDGPGCRTLIFLSGCPLSCPWCANPEGLKMKQQMLYSKQLCKRIQNNCERCIPACPHGAITGTDDPEMPLIFDRNLCNKCTTFDCTKACYFDAARLSGYWKTVSELMAIIKRDRQYWVEGGVSFTGGEPLLQSDFLIDVLEKCKMENIHTAIETSAHINSDDFLKVMKNIDFAFIDIKHADTEKHREVIGVGNELILGNIALLKKVNWPGRLILRMPVIAGFNDTDSNTKATIDFMSEYDLFEINILPFHRLGASKWQQLGKTYPYDDALPTEKHLLDHIQKMYLDHQIACYIGEEVLY